MHGTGRQLWLEYVRVCVAIFLLQYKPHNIHAHQDQQILFALQISLITFKLQGHPPKNKKRSIYVCTWGRRNQIFERHTFLWKKVWGRIIS